MGTGKKYRVAILLNAFVLPGVGHFYLGYKIMGTLLSLSCTFFVIAPIIKYTMLATKVLDMVSVAANSKNASLLRDLYASSSLIWPEVRNLTLIAIFGIIAVWLYGIVDIFLKSRKDQQNIEKSC